MVGATLLCAYILPIEEMGLAVMYILIYDAYLRSCGSRQEEGGEDRTIRGNIKPLLERELYESWIDARMTTHTSLHHVPARSFLMP